MSTSVQVTQIHSFLWLNNIPLYHNFFIHSSFDRHLGCFYVLAIINSAAMNIGIHVSLNSLFFYKCFPSWTSHSLGFSHLTYLFLWLNLFWFLLISLTGASLSPTISVVHLLYIYALVVSIGSMTLNTTLMLTTPKFTSSVLSS